MFGMKGRGRFLLAAMASPLAIAAPQLTLTATHGLDIARPSEMIAVPWQDVARALPGAMMQKLVVKDAAGQVLPYQVVNFDYDAKGIKPGFAELLFQHDFAAGQHAATFTIERSETIVAPFPAKTFARLVPERLDDFAWENDRIAHRTYGPALAAPDSARSGKEVLVASGIDVWSKRVRYPVIDRWYNKGSYHRDDGEGFDMYKTGNSRGTGGTGIWDGKQLHISGNFVSWKILANGPIRTVFELAYAPWEANGVKVAEVKRFTVDAGHNLDTIDSTFTYDGGQPLTVGLGITKNSAEKDQFGSVEVQRAESGKTLLQWEAQKSNGELGEAVVLPQGAAGFAEDGANQLILARVQSGQPLHYLAGAGWSKSGDFPNKQAWFAYVADAAARAAAPLTIKLSVN